ncbi:hypothetical protein H5410_055736 [Solanum commersonii]|uniref:Uncharacterized protein n=1 Tax=Solanum commersonii TaxID=4109 RepID=A0A9J5WJ74_SOLCO|nr:hypothetical protein H5410_055736 [Solanum commersonii]
MNRLEIRGLSHVYREQNRVDDVMAKEGMKKQHFDNVEVFFVPPVIVQKMVEADTPGTIYGRDVVQTNIITTNVQPNAVEAQHSIDKNA